MKYFGCKSTAATVFENSLRPRKNVCIRREEEQINAFFLDFLTILKNEVRSTESKELVIEYGVFCASFCAIILKFC